MTAICGWFSDRISARRWPLLLGLIALTGATVMLNVGTSIAVLVVGRLLQGISAAAVWVVGLALLVDTIDESRLGQCMGYVSLGMSVGMLIAPLLGGVVFQRAGYNAVFAICYAFIALDFVFRIVFIEKKDAVKWLDQPTAADTSATAPPTELADNITATSVPEESSETRRIHASGCEDREKGSNTSARPRHDNSNIVTDDSNDFEVKKSRLPAFVTLLASRRLLASLFACLIEASLITSFDSVLPLFVYQTFHWYSLQAGILYLAIVIPSFISPVVGHLCDRYGPRWLATSGFVCAAPLFVLLRLVTHNSPGQKVLLAALLALIGLALTSTFQPLMAEISYVVSAKEKARPGAYGKGGAYAQAYGLFNMAWAGGSLVGPIWAGFIEKQAGWGTMAWSLGLLSGLTAIPTAIWVGGSIAKRD